MQAKEQQFAEGEAFWRNVMRAPLSGGAMTFVSPESGGQIVVSRTSETGHRSLEREARFHEDLAAGRMTAGPVTPARRAEEPAAPIRGAVVLPLHRAAEPRAAEPRKETPMPKDKDVVWSEIQQAAKSFAAPTEAQRIAGFIKANPSEYQRYKEAPWPTVPADVAPQVMSRREAERHLAVNQRSPAAIDSYFAAAGRERAAASGGKLTKEQGYAEVALERPDLYRAYQEGMRAGRQ